MTKPTPPKVQCLCEACMRESCNCSRCYIAAFTAIGVAYVCELIAIAVVCVIWSNA